MSKMTAIVIAIATSACADSSSPQASATEQKLAWVAYTHASCNGAILDQRHVLCVAPSSADKLEPGDAEAHGWVSIWKGACLAEQGRIGTELEGTLCVDDALQALPYGCDANLVPTYQACE